MILWIVWLLSFLIRLDVIISKEVSSLMPTLVLLQEKASNYTRTHFLDGVCVGGASMRLHGIEYYYYYFFKFWYIYFFKHCLKNGSWHGRKGGRKLGFSLCNKWATSGAPPTIERRHTHTHTHTVLSHFLMRFRVYIKFIFTRVKGVGGVNSEMRFMNYADRKCILFFLFKTGSALSLSS